MSTDDLYGAVLDGVYESMPSLPGLVLTARLLNRQQKREDTPENSYIAIVEMTRLLCSIDLAVLERKHYENTSESPPTPKRSHVASRVDAQLAEVTELDKRLRAANETLKTAIEDHKRLTVESRALLSEFSQLSNGFSVSGNIFGGAETMPGSNPWLLTCPTEWSQSSLGGLMRHFTVDETTPNSPEEGAVADAAVTSSAVVAPVSHAATPPVLGEDKPAEDKQAEEEMPPRPTRLRRARRIDT
jgi:hypothetical protein